MLLKAQGAIVLKIISLGLFLSLSLQTVAWGNETNDYLAHLSDVAANLLHLDYKLLGGVTRDGVDTPGPCKGSCEKLIKTLESGKSNFVKPIIYTNSPDIFYAALVANTPCRGLGILSYVDSIAGMGYSTDQPFLDFFRPTRGFAIYKMKSDSNEILLLRAENYEDSGQSAKTQTAFDAEVKPSDLQKVGSDNTVKARGGEFIVMKSDTCTSEDRIIFDKSASYNASTQISVYENDSWLANPITYDHQIYILNSLIFYPIPERNQPYTEYYERLTKLKYPRSPDIEFYYYR